MQLQTLRDLFEHEVGDLYSAETQLVTALPKMAQAASNEELAMRSTIISTRRATTFGALRRSASRSVAQCLTSVRECAA